MLGCHCADGLSWFWELVMRLNKQLVVFSLLMLLCSRRGNFFPRWVVNYPLAGPRVGDDACQWVHPVGHSYPLLPSPVICASRVPILSLPRFTTRPQLCFSCGQHLHVLGCIMFCLWHQKDFYLSFMTNSVQVNLHLSSWYLMLRDSDWYWECHSSLFLRLWY